MHTLAQLKKLELLLLLSRWLFLIQFQRHITNIKASHVFHPNVGLFEITGPLGNV
jgi:hypothetical protein